MLVGFITTSLLPNISYAGDGISGITVTMNGTNGYSVAGIDDGDGLSTVTNNVRDILMFVSAIVVFTLAIVFVMNIGKLGTSSGNPQARSQAVTSLLWTGAAITLVGGAGIGFKFFYDFL